MINEHDTVVLTEDLANEGLRAGDIGTVVHVHKNGAGYEVEFMTLDGEPITIVSVDAAQVRAVAHRELAHVRSI